MAGTTGTAIRCEATAELLGERRIARLPQDASDLLPSRGQVAVAGTIDGAPFSTVVEPDGHRGHWIRLDDDVEPGASVTFELTPTKAWPEPEVPHDLRSALDEAPDLDVLWATITPMARWEWVRWVAATANPDTRARRVEVSISKLRDGKRRPCCFDLSSCTVPDVARSGKLMPPAE